MNDYTPSFERVRDVYSWAYAWRTRDNADEGETDLSGLRESNRTEFDRALATHDREVAAKTLRDAAERYRAETHPDSDLWNPLAAGSDDFEGILLRYAALVSEPSTPELLERARAEAANDAFVDAVAWARSCSGESADVAADYIQEMYTRTPSTPEGDSQ